MTGAPTGPAGGPEPHRRGRVFQWAQEHGELGGVMTSHRQMTAVLRAGGYEVSYVDTGSASRAARAAPSLWRRSSVHVLHVTKLRRAAVLAPVFAVLPGRTALVLHSGSTAGQLSAMTGRQRRVVLRALRAFGEIWAVSEAIRDVLPPDLATRTTVVTPFDRDGVTAGAALPPTRDPHGLVLATNSGLAHYNAQLGVEAVRLVREHWPDATLRLLAYGHRGPELATLRAEVAGLDWVDLRFDRPAEEVTSLLAAAGVLLRPTSWDGDSVIVREALATGARVVASGTSPRPRGVELAGLDAREIAQVVLHGGVVSDGAGLVGTTLAQAAARLLQAARPERSGARDNL